MDPGLSLSWLTLAKFGIRKTGASLPGLKMQKQKRLKGSFQLSSSCAIRQLPPGLYPEYQSFDSIR